MRRGGREGSRCERWGVRERTWRVAAPATGRGGRMACLIKRAGRSETLEAGRVMFHSESEDVTG